MKGQLNLLVIEDSEDDAFLLVRELERSGYKTTYERVETAETMRSALLRKEWDLIITDYSMPRFNALSALEIYTSSGLEIPFIIVSGTIGEARAIRALKAGANAFLNKSNLSGLTSLVEHELREAENRKDRRLARAALRDRERYFRALIENTSDIILTMNADGSISYASPAIQRVLGYTTADYIGINILQILYPEDQPLVEQLFNRLQQNPHQNTFAEFRLQHKEGYWVWLEAIATNLLDEPGIHAIVANLRDVTERKELMAQLLQSQKMEAIGQLTAGIAHDFNNMLTVINSYAQLLIMKVDPADPNHRIATKIMEGGDRAAKLVQQLLTFSHKQLVSLETTAIGDVISRVNNMLSRIIGEHINISTMIAPDLWPIKADSAQIEQVVMNLAVNARDAMPNGGHLEIKAENIEVEDGFSSNLFKVQPGSYVLMSIRDNGVGMTDEVKEHLFEPFFTTKEVGKGTGLGLAIVYGIVEQCGATIQIDSELGRGTEVKIYFPKSSDSEINETESGKTAESKTTVHETILIVEDNSDVRQLAVEILEEKGYKILEAIDVYNALEIAELHPEPIDLLLTDIIMPGINGRDLAERLLLVRPNLKVLYMSGYFKTDVSTEPLDTTNNLLPKPYTPKQLINKIREVLDAP